MGGVCCCVTMSQATSRYSLARLLLLLLLLLSSSSLPLSLSLLLLLEWLLIGGFTDVSFLAEVNVVVDVFTNTAGAEAAGAEDGAGTEIGTGTGAGASFVTAMGAVILIEAIGAVALTIVDDGAVLLARD